MGGLRYLVFRLHSDPRTARLSFPGFCCSIFFPEPLEGVEYTTYTASLKILLFYPAFASQSRDSLSAEIANAHNPPGIKNGGPSGFPHPFSIIAEISSAHHVGPPLFLRRRNC